MPSHPRNMPEQERSIKARSHELFVEPVQAAEANKPTKPFPVYLRETPAQPLSPLTKAVFWIVGIIVAGLFLAAVWRISHRQKSKVPVSFRPAKTVMVQRQVDADRRTIDQLHGASRRPMAGLAYFPVEEPSGMIRYKWTP
jgi:hypothetical protein